LNNEVGPATAFKLEPKSIDLLI